MILDVFYLGSMMSLIGGILFARREIEALKEEVALLKGQINAVY